MPTRFDLPLEKLKPGEVMYPDQYICDMVEARYVPHVMVTDDPDLCALPKLSSNKELMDTVTIGLPGYDYEDVRAMRKSERKENVLALQKVFCPLAHTMEMAKAVDDALVSSYLSREVKMNSSRTALTSTRSGYGGRPLSFVVYGLSGCGKTVAINFIRKMYPSSIHHVLGRIEYTQIPIIMVTALVGNMRELMLAIARAIDDVIGNGPVWEGRARCSNLGLQAAAIKEAIRMYHIGLIIIDESQFLKFDGSNASLENLIGVAEETGCTLGFIGNKDLIPKMDRYPRFVSRTMLNRIEVNCTEPASQMFFQKAVYHLWKYQWTKEYTEMTPEIMDELIKASMYNISILKAVLMRIQSEAISKYPDGGITPKYIRSISDKYFATIRTLILDGSEESERIVLKQLKQNEEAIKADAKNLKAQASLKLLEERQELSDTWGPGRFEALEKAVRAYGVSSGNLRKIISRLQLQDPGLPQRDISSIADDVRQYLDDNKVNVNAVSMKRKKEFDAEGETLVREVMKDSLKEMKENKAV